MESIKIEPKHQEIKINEDGSVYSRQPATWLFLDGQNKLQQKVQADSISEISKNLLKIHASGSIQLTDYNLKAVSNTRIQTLENFINGKAIFSVDQHYGVIRNDGTIVIEPKYINLKCDNNYFISNTRQGGKDQWILLDSIGKLASHKTIRFYTPAQRKILPGYRKKFLGRAFTFGKGDTFLHLRFDSPAT